MFTSNEYLFRLRKNVDLTFDEIILDAARSIAGATTALVKSASVAQRELIHQGRLDLTNNETRYHDGQWTDGLISAAQQVAQATGTLCEAANDTKRFKYQYKLILTYSCRKCSFMTSNLKIVLIFTRFLPFLLFKETQLKKN